MRRVLKGQELALSLDAARGAMLGMVQLRMISRKAA
jgi:hypothetical protein